MAPSPEIAGRDGNSPNLLVKCGFLPCPQTSLITYTSFALPILNLLRINCLSALRYIGTSIIIFLRLPRLLTVCNGSHRERET